jgi:hypothetical protein
MGWQADRRLYATADGSRLVEQDDPEAGVLFVAEGDMVDDGAMRRYGLDDKGKLKATKNRKAAGEPVPSVSPDATPAEEPKRESKTEKAKNSRSVARRQGPKADKPKAAEQPKANDDDEESGKDAEAKAQRPAEDKAVSGPAESKGA